mmetsp:Transcript_4222/g.11654  ORF Transcript_4222/g.11654 Transcript_4222/m.11654 type:complete len:215 (+) Transcript_4222:1035-1679(+)
MHRLSLINEPVLVAVVPIRMRHAGRVGQWVVEGRHLRLHSTLRRGRFLAGPLEALLWCDRHHQACRSMSPLLEAQAPLAANDLDRLGVLTIPLGKGEDCAACIEPRHGRRGGLPTSARTRSGHPPKGRRPEGERRRLHRVARVGKVRAYQGDVADAATFEELAGLVHRWEEASPHALEQCHTFCFRGFVHLLCGQQRIGQRLLTQDVLTSTDRL